MLDVTNLLFVVDDNRRVFLCFGPVRVLVCETPEDFGEFQERLVEQLDMIRHELADYYVEGKTN